ncbi:hypothetical protein GCM10011609_02690 [Lentzea pudingi]|uniref:Uncharacterized protein n=1 Tax=Lentzea pudingi TaxID=1789439 RepID=A0ABQ2H973_9PSEU|nr:WXG100 family type VII secretion target [Lentzea pudingi]GGM70465.1 hypothetical protein GCM10011609_02690 [Lentzea pudingi]
MSWDALGHDDPVPGDPAGVQQVAHRLGAVSLGVTEASERLDAINRGLSRAQWTGAAAEAFGRSVADLVPDLRKLSTSFALAESALVRYADELESAQRTAAQAETNAREAGTERTGALARKAAADQESAQHRRTAHAALVALTAARTAQTLAAATGDVAGAAREQARAEQSEAQRVRATASEAAARGRSGVAAGQIAGAEARQQAARRLAESAREVREHAGRRAAAEIDDASDAGIQNKNIGDHVGEWWNGVVRSPEFDHFLNVLDKFSDVLLDVAPLMPIICAVGGGLLGIAGGPAGIAAGIAGGFKTGVAVGNAMGVAAVLTKAAVLGGRAEQQRTGVRGGDAVAAATWKLAGAAATMVAGRMRLGASDDLQSLGGPVKRILSYEDNRHLSGHARTILHETVTVAPKPSNALDAAKITAKAYDGLEGVESSVRDTEKSVGKLGDGPTSDAQMLRDAKEESAEDFADGAHHVAVRTLLGK